jgi:membrane protein implicated in regulation of membrane protease activity
MSVNSGEDFHMIDKLFDNPTTAFIAVATVITILILLSRLFLKRNVLLWKSTLISYTVFVIFMYAGVLYEHSSFGETPLYEIPFRTLAMILLAPGMLIYAFFPGAIKMCPSNFDEFAIDTIGFLFYAVVIWGIMKLIKRRKETKATEKKQDNKLEKQTPTEPKT